MHVISCVHYDLFHTEFNIASAYILNNLDINIHVTRRCI
jgi:hypothetical protein